MLLPQKKYHLQNLTNPQTLYRERQDIEDTDRMARARYYEAKAAEYLEKIKGFQAARKLIGATEKAKAQAAVERLAAGINRAKKPRLKSNQPKELNLFSGLSSEQGISSSVTPAPEEPNLFSNFSTEQGISSSVTPAKEIPSPESNQPANPRKARGKTERTTEIAKGVIRKIKGSGDEGLKPEHRAKAEQIKKEKANKGKPSRKPKPRDDEDSDDSDSSWFPGLS